MIIRKYEDADVPQMNAIWNEVVMDGIAFPQEECLDPETGREFFASQSYCGVAQDEGGKGCRTLYPASQQYRPVRAYRQCQLCSVLLLPGSAYRRDACDGQPEKGEGMRLQGYAVQCCCGE